MSASPPPPPPPDPNHPWRDFTVEDRVQLAVKAINASLTPSGSRTLSLSEACRIYDVKRGMLTNRLNGIKTKRDAHIHERLLTEAEESVLAEWAMALGHRGTPVTLAMLGQYASVRSFYPSSCQYYF